MSDELALCPVCDREHRCEMGHEVCQRCIDGIQTQFVNPPIPIRSQDWSAVTANYDCDYSDELGFFSNLPVGRGATEQAAIDDLLSQLLVDA
jgi:hypothetical protein